MQIENLKKDVTEIMNNEKIPNIEIYNIILSVYGKQDLLEMMLNTFDNMFDNDEIKVFSDYFKNLKKKYTNE